MHRFCNSWRVRHLLLILLRFNRPPKLAEFLASSNTRMLRPSTNSGLYLTIVLLFSHVVDNSSTDAFPFPQIFIEKQVYYLPLAT